MPSLDKKLKALQDSPVFQDVPRSDLTKIAELLQEEFYPAGYVLMDLGAKPDKVYLIQKGSFKISRSTSWGEETILEVLQKGNVVGELATLDGKVRSARATCQQDTIVFSIERKDFAKIVKKNPAISFNLLKEVGGRLRKANDNVVKSLEAQRKENETRLGKLEQLMEASKIINSTLNLDKLLGVILEAATLSLEADRGTLYLVDDLKQELWSKVAQGDDMVEIRLPVGKGIAGHVAKTGETINIPDAYNDSRFNPEVDKRTGYHTRNMLCMAMKNKDSKTIGVFQLLNKKSAAFDKSDEQYIDALSAHASVAIENARLAQEMVQSERLSAVGRMASTIIHDIKNPMGTLRVYAQVMKKKSGNEEAAKLADEMIHQVDRFVNMAQEILDFSKGQSSMNIQELDFAEMMNSVLDFIQKDLEKNKVELIRKTNFSGKVNMDQDKMVRVLYNVASNARDAMPQGGSLTVTTEKQNDFVRIDFKDSGTGMPEEVKKRIFEPFMTFGKKHGTGLGMSIVKKVIDDHKGRIDIESEMGKGTTIHIYLPV